MTTTTPAGFSATWRYTTWSLWFYVVFAFMGPVARLCGDLLDGVRPIRSIVVLVLLAVVAWWSCRPLIARAREGLGRASWSSREIASLMAPALLLLPVAWVPPAMPIGLAFPAWLVAGLVATDLRPGVRWWWLAVWAGGPVGAYLVAVGPDALREVEGSAVVTLMFMVLFIGVLPTFQVWLWDLMLQVRSSGEAEAELAAVRERLRMAADLHDVQGHHLQVIALKAELAGRQIDRDPAAAATSIAEVQQVARDAIHETRDLVRGYRRTSLREEVANAASVLEAAGAQVLVDVPPDLEDEVFALVLREATTNILRHSSASTVRIEAAPGRFLVQNDGAPRAGDPGTGLAALTSRVAESGGRLDVRHDDSTFRLEVTR